MLYVFQVDTGSMMTFDMKLAMETVSNLKKALTTKTDIPEDKQVLLISGGESLNNAQRVCSYSSAGTDTSPIFLFAKVNIESNQPPVLRDYEDDTDMTEMIESCMSMQPSLDTLVARTELAADLNEQAIRQKETCERLVHDQHLQQQGWAAVTANLEDLTRALKSKSDLLMIAYDDFIKRKSEFKELLENFGDGIKHLNSIPILPALLEGNKPVLPCPASSSITMPSNKAPGQKQPKSIPQESQQSEQNIRQTEKSCSTQPTSQEDESVATDEQEETFLDASTEYDQSNVSASHQAQSTISDETPMTLRQWIDYHDSQNSLEKLIEVCWRGLERFTSANSDQIRLEVQELLKSTNNTSMKEIKGLEERLFGLEKLMSDAKKCVDEQTQLAASFHNNRERFSKIKDSTLLPDLSASHKQQLHMMLNNHKRMSDYRTRCLKAKHELSINLHARLKWIMYVEQQISDLDGKLMIYKENLVRLNKQFDIVGQVHRAPDLYLDAVVESLRRRRFTRHYLHWASTVAKISQDIYEKEIQARKSFDSKLCSHFLSGLFPGLSRSYPPPFATVQPDPFDTKLPRVTAADIQYLQANLETELAEKLHIPQVLAMPHVIVKGKGGPRQLCKKVAGDDCQQEAAEETEDLEDRHSLNPTPPSSPR